LPLSRACQILGLKLRHHGRNRIRLTNGFRRFDIRMFGTRRLVGVLGNALLIRRVCRQLSFALIDIIEIFEFVLPNCKLWLMYYL